MLGQIHINEFQSSNQTGIQDEDGDFEDWIEIHNSSANTISLGNWFISDNDRNIRKWQLPPNVSIPPGGFLLIWASGKNRQQSLHTNFKISSSGEPLLLSNADGNLIDRIDAIQLSPDQSFGRVPDGGGLLERFHTPTPGTSNLIDGVAPIAVNLIFSHEDGYYDDPFSLQIHASNVAEIRYTLDGSDPDTSGTTYTQPIEVTSRIGDPNTISEIRSGVDHHWLPPLGEVPKIVVIRAKPYANNKPCGEEIWGSWWTGHHNPQNLKNEIVSLQTHPFYFFNYHHGIYIPGVDWDSLQTENSWRRGRENEVPALVSYFDSTGVKQIHQAAGARVHGGATRRAGQKTLRLYARNEYGNDLFNYPFFPERDHADYRRLLLQTTYGDFAKSIMKDELTTRIVNPLGLEVLNFKPVLVFLNGEYWALHFLKERRDEHYLSGLSGVPSEHIDFLNNNQRVAHGSADHYAQTLAFIDNSDPEEPELLSKIDERIDVNNYIDYQICQIFFANSDWPDNNIDYWRPDTIGGRWRWIFYDLDASMRLYELDNLSWYFNEFDPLVEEQQWPRHLLRSMMRIPEFKNRFLVRFEELMAGPLSTENMMREIEKLKNEIEPFVSDYIYRWRIPRSKTEWEDNISILTTFAMRRPAFMKQLLNENLGSSLSAYPNPTKDFINIRKRIGSFHEQDIQEVFIQDLQGKKLPFKHQFIEGELQLEVSSLPAGSYILRITMNNRYHSIPVVVVKP